MSEPQFDPSTGRWYIRYHVAPGERVKKLLAKHDGWKKLNKRPKTVPPQVSLEAREYQDLDRAGRAGAASPRSRMTNLKEYTEDYVRSYEKRRKANSLKNLKNTVTRFLEFCATHGIADIRAVDVPACRKYIEEMHEEDYAHGSMTLHRAVIGAIFARATEDKLIVENPWKSKSLEIPGDADEEGTPAWTNSEIKTLLAVLEGDTRDLFLIGINCGFRCQALRHMLWGWVEWQVPGRRRGLLKCPKEWSKNGKAYAVPLFSELHDALAARNATAANTGKYDLVFTGDGSTGLVNASQFGYKLRAACQKAGIEWRGHAWHSMRATFATRYLEKGARPRAVQAWMSHASLKMTDKYLKWSGESDDDEVDRLESPVKPPGEDRPASHDPEDGRSAGP